MLCTLAEKIATYVPHFSDEDVVERGTDAEHRSCPIDGGKGKRRLSVDTEGYSSAPKRRKVEQNFLGKLANLGSRMAEWLVRGKNHLLSHWEANGEDKQRSSQVCCDKHCQHSGVQCLPQPLSEANRNLKLGSPSEHNPGLSSGEVGRAMSKKNSKLKESQFVPNQTFIFKNKQHHREPFNFKKGTQPKAFQKPIQLHKNYLHPARINGGQRVDSPFVLTRSKLYSIPIKPWQHADICKVTCKQQMSTAEEYIRLEEKERYAQLLKQCTSGNFQDTSTNSVFQCQKSRSSSTSERSSNVPTVRDVASVNQLRRPAIVTSDSDQERSLSDLPSLQKWLSFSDTDTSQHSEHNFENSSACHDTNSSLEEKTSSKDSSEHLSTSPVPNMKAIKILNEHWMEALLSKFSASKLEMKMKIEEEQLKVKSFEQQRKSREYKVHLEIQRRLKLIQREVPVIPEPEPESEKPLVPKIDELMQHDIDTALRPYPAEDVLVDAFRIQLKRQDMATLSGLTWLNDAVINFYMCMLMERSNEAGFSKIYAFNTFFYPKLLSSKYDGVRRWTRKVDIFSYKYLLIPIHLEMHWCLAVVNFYKKTISYYDSIGGKNTQCLETIKNYLCEESLDKKNLPFKLTGWTTVTVKNIPHQMNGSDCGMFACKYADYITRELPISFTQADMPTFRRLMVYEILKKKLLT